MKFPKALIIASQALEVWESYLKHLSSYEDVKAHAGAIYERLNDGSMPCDGPWFEAQVELFKKWTEEGMAP